MHSVRRNREEGKKRVGVERAQLRPADGDAEIYVDGLKERKGRKEGSLLRSVLSSSFT